MVWRYGGQVAFVPNVALIRLIVSEKMGFTDGRMAEGVRTPV